MGLMDKLKTFSTTFGTKGANESEVARLLTEASKRIGEIQAMEATCERVTGETLPKARPTTLNFVGDADYRSATTDDKIAFLKAYLESLDTWEQQLNSMTSTARTGAQAERNAARQLQTTVRGVDRAARQQALRKVRPVGVYDSFDNATKQRKRWESTGINPVFHQILSFEIGIRAALRRAFSSIGSQIFDTTDDKGNDIVRFCFELGGGVPIMVQFRTTQTPAQIIESLDEWAARSVVDVWVNPLLQEREDGNGFELRDDDSGYGAQIGPYRDYKVLIYDPGEFEKLADKPIAGVLDIVDGRWVEVTWDLESAWVAQNPLKRYVTDFARISAPGVYASMVRPDHADELELDQVPLEYDASKPPPAKDYWCLKCTGHFTHRRQNRRNIDVCPLCREENKDPDNPIFSYINPADETPVATASEATTTTSE